MFERGTSEELMLIVKEVADGFARFRPCKHLTLNVIYGGSVKSFTKEIMVCTTEKRLLSLYGTWYRCPQINENCFLKANYQSFKKIYLELDNLDRAIYLKFGIIDRRDEWVWCMGRYMTTEVSMEARPDPNKKEYALPLKDVFKNIFKASALGLEGVRMTDIFLDGVYVNIYDLDENDAYFLFKKVLPFLADLIKSGLRWFICIR